MFHKYSIIVHQDSAPLLSSQYLPPFVHLRFRATPVRSKSGRRLLRSFVPPKQTAFHIFSFIYPPLLLTSLFILQKVDCTTQIYRWNFPCRIVGLKSGYCTYFRSTQDRFVTVSLPPVFRLSLQLHHLLLSPNIRCRCSIQPIHVVALLQCLKSYGCKRFW